MKLEELDLERYAQDPQEDEEVVFIGYSGWEWEVGDRPGDIATTAYVRADLAPEVFGMLRRSRVDPEELWKAIEKMLSLARSLEFKEKLERDFNQGYPATKELRDLREESYQQRVRVRKMVEDL